MKKINLSIYLLFILSSIKCISHSGVIKNPEYDIKLNLKEVKFNGDSSVLYFYLKNKTNDTLIFPNKYVQVDLVLEDKEIYKSNHVRAKILYPLVDYQNDEQKTKILNSNCRPLLDIKHYCFLAKGDSILIPVDITNMGYTGFKKDKQYKIKIELRVSNEIKKYCAKIWSGFSESDYFVIQWQ